MSAVMQHLPWTLALLAPRVHITCPRDLQVWLVRWLLELSSYWQQSGLRSPSRMYKLVEVRPLTCVNQQCNQN